MAEYIDFEANVSGNDSDDDVEMTNDDNDNSFIDDEPMFDEQGPSFYDFINQTLDPKKVQQECIEEESKLLQNMEGSNYNFFAEDKFEQKIDDFKGSEKRIQKFKETLINPVGLQNRENALLHAIIYAIRFQKKC